MAEAKKTTGGTAGRKTSTTAGRKTSATAAKSSTAAAAKKTSSTAARKTSSTAAKKTSTAKKKTSSAKKTTQEKTVEAILNVLSDIAAGKSMDQIMKSVEKNLGKAIGDKGSELLLSLLGRKSNAGALGSLLGGLAGKRELTPELIAGIAEENDLTEADIAALIEQFQAAESEELEIQSIPAPDDSDGPVLKLL